MKKTALIVGSSGLVGKELLDLCLKSEVYEKVITPVRAPLSIKNEKLIELIIDFEMPPWDQLFPADHVYCCLGTTIKKAGNQSEFKKVDLDYCVSFAKKAREAGASKISIVSSVGANPVSYTHLTLPTKA